MVKTAKNMRELLIENYSMIETTRMEGVPILNTALSVAAIGFEEHGPYRLGIMLTPWFMNLMMVPLDASVIDKDQHKFGSTQHYMLPSGKFSFIVGYEEDIGFYLSCSLFSPVFEFADQEAFEETARSVLDEVLTPAALDEEDAESEDTLADAEMREIWAGRLPEAETLEYPEGANIALNEVDQEAMKEAEIPKSKIPSLSSQMSRRDLLRGMRTPDSEPETGKEAS